MPYLMSFALEHEIVTFAWIDNASVQFPLNIYATKGKSRSRHKEALKIGICQTKMSVVTLAPTKSAVFPRTARIYETVWRSNERLEGAKASGDRVSPNSRSTR